MQSIRDAQKWRDALCTEKDEIDDDWITIDQLAKVLNRGLTQTKIKAKKAIKEGRIKKKKISIYQNGTNTIKNYYKLL